jgi:hypothetical protein
MMHMKCGILNIKRIAILILSSVIGGCWLGLNESDNYYLSFEAVDGIVVETYGKPATTYIQKNIDRPLNYRLERPFYTLYIRHYERNYSHPQYTLQAITHDGEELRIELLIPQSQWPIGEDGWIKSIYRYQFKPIWEQNRRERLGTEESTDKTRILIWTNAGELIKNSGDAKDYPLNRIDLALFDSNGTLVAEERLPVTHVKNGVSQTYDY